MLTTAEATTSPAHTSRTHPPPYSSHVRRREYSRALGPPRRMSGARRALRGGAQVLLGDVRERLSQRSFFVALNASPRVARAGEPADDDTAVCAGASAHVPPCDEMVEHAGDRRRRHLGGLGELSDGSSPRSSSSIAARTGRGLSPGHRAALGARAAGEGSRRPAQRLSELLELARAPLVPPR